MVDAVVGLRERKRVETWQALRRAAAGLIETNGYDSVTVDEIAAAAGVSKRTFFNYFPSKESVVFDPDPHEPARWRALADGRPTGEPLWLSLEHFFLGYLELHRVQLPIHRRLIMSSPTLAQLARVTSDEFSEFLTAWIAERLGGDGARRFEAAAVTSAALGVLNIAFFAWDPDLGPSELHGLIERGFEVVEEHTSVSVRETTR